MEQVRRLVSDDDEYDYSLVLQQILDTLDDLKQLLYDIQNTVKRVELKCSSSHSSKGGYTDRDLYNEVRRLINVIKWLALLMVIMGIAMILK